MGSQPWRGFDSLRSGGQQFCCLFSESIKQRKSSIERGPRKAGLLVVILVLAPSSAKKLGLRKGKFMTASEAIKEHNRLFCAWKQDIDNEELADAVNDFAAEHFHTLVNEIVRLNEKVSLLESDVYLALNQ